MNLLIKKYKQFLETYIPDQTDAPEITSDMNRFNGSESQIKEFGTKKVTINNIYMTYKDEKDLIDKLVAQKFIDRTGNKKTIQFNNPLLGLWAQSCDKRRELKDMEDQISKWDQSIKDEQDNLKNNPSSADVVNANIKLTEDKISQKKQEVAKKQTEILNLEKLANDKLKQLRSELTNSKKRLDMYRANKLSKK